jgi:hypothetical protein
VTNHCFGDRSFVHDGIDCRHIEIIGGSFHL